MKMNSIGLLKLIAMVDFVRVVQFVFAPGLSTFIYGALIQTPLDYHVQVCPHLLIRDVEFVEKVQRLDIQMVRGF